MPINTIPAGTVGAPTDLTEAAKSTPLAPNNLTEIAGLTPASPVNLTTTSVVIPAAPNDLAEVTALSPATPSNLTEITALAPSAPNNLTETTAVTPASPNTLTTIAGGMNRTLVPLIDLQFSAGAYGINGSSVSFADAVTYSRASSATYLETYRDALGREAQRITTVGANVPRFEKEGYLTEGASTNLALRSEEFDNAVWNKTGSTVTANAGLAPDLTDTADLLVDNTALTVHQASQTLTLVDNTNYTYSIYVKSNTLSQCSLLVVTKAGVNLSAIFDLAQISIISESIGITSKIEPIGINGWYRLQITYNSESGATTPQAVFRLASGGVTAYTGTGTGSVFIWGAQVEALDGASSYIKTEGAAVSRAADVMTRPISIWRGNLSVKAKSLFNPVLLDQFILSIYNLDFNNSISISSLSGESSGFARCFIRQSSETTFDFVSTETAWDEKNKASLNFAPNNAIAYVGDDSSGIDNSVTIPNTNTISFGFIPSGANVRFYGHIEYVKVFDVALTANEVKSL
jgi:hypothetical protein